MVGAEKTTPTSATTSPGPAATRTGSGVRINGPVIRTHAGSGRGTATLTRIS
ncbi:hypothetical protein GCM10022267_76190 [Lentzea roselyniae]|uniref:Uncharacterized protein n=1 Tax=Lentzea roselyniae TaxID=531940 RepID=A0ABP7C326_9PSEU